MSRTPRQVDLGPMSMPVGDDCMVWRAPKGRDSDVVQFKALMQSPGHSHREHTDDPLEQAVRDIARDAASPDERSIGGEIGRLLVGWGGSTAREVRIGLRPEVLPNTTLRIFEAQGQLRIELTVGSPDVAAWLAGRLGAVARDIGRDLDRDIGIWVLAGGTGEVLGSAFWPDGSRR